MHPHQNYSSSKLILSIIIIIKSSNHQVIKSSWSWSSSKLIIINHHYYQFDTLVSIHVASNSSCRHDQGSNAVDQNDSLHPDHPAWQQLEQKHHGILAYPVWTDWFHTRIVRPFGALVHKQGGSRRFNQHNEDKQFSMKTTTENPTGPRSLLLANWRLFVKGFILFGVLEGLGVCSKCWFQSSSNFEVPENVHVKKMNHCLTHSSKANNPLRGPRNRSWGRFGFGVSAVLNSFITLPLAVHACGTKISAW